MFVNVNLIVICVVLLNFGVCKNCDDVLKCVTTLVDDVLSPNLNVTSDIKDSSVNVSTFYESPDSNDNLLTKLSDYLVEKFSALIKEGPLLKTIGENTKIYVQSFQINESGSESKPDIVSEIKPLVFNNNQSNTNIDNNTNNATTLNSNIIVNKSVTSFLYDNNDRDTTLKSVSIAQKNSTHKKSDNKNNTTNIENTTYSSSDIIYQETVSGSVYLSTIDIQETTEFIDTTTENFSGVYAVTNKIIENSNVNALDINNIQAQDQTAEQDSIDKINIKDNYIDDTNELYGTNEIHIAEIVHDNMTDYLDIDYVDMYKDTTNEDVEYTSAVYIPTTTASANIIAEKKPTDGVDSVYPWIATVFVMNSDSKQFEYICDGTLLSERVVLTAARCISKNNVTVDTANILIIMGKRSLQSTGPNEKITRVKSIKIHDDFVSSEGKVDNDLAIAVLAEPVLFNVDIKPAPLGIEDKSFPLAAATTGWHFSGPLKPLYLGLKSMGINRKDDICNNLYCATLSDSETTCPSFGGMFIERQDDDQWRLKGIASGNPTSRGVCFNKNLIFTKIENYLDWIKTKIQENSSK